MTAWDPNKDGERRRDENSVRLALLEKAVCDAEERDREFKESLGAVHARMTHFQDDFRNALSEGFSKILGKIESSEKARIESCQTHRDRTTRLESTVRNIEWTVGGAWAALLALFGIYTKK
ncbi:hypothetical protein CCP3SC1AL1_110032 [Gammaproteobacteria bacterium]